VAGTVEYTSEPANVDARTAFANYLLSLGANTTSTTDANSNGNTEDYETSSTDYNGTLSGGVDAGAILDVSAYTWVLAKYDGRNGGFVLFNVADAGGTIPEFSNPLWGAAGTQQYQLSGVTAFGGTSVPDGGSTMLLLGAALTGLGTLRRFIKA
jgi:hypothetical protein